MYRKKAFFRAFESFEAEREKVRGGGGGGGGGVGFKGFGLKKESERGRR